MPVIRPANFVAFQQSPSTYEAVIGKTLIFVMDRGTASEWFGDTGTQDFQLTVSSSVSVQSTYAGFYDVNGKLMTKFPLDSNGKLTSFTFDRNNTRNPVIHVSVSKEMLRNFPPDGSLAIIIYTDKVIYQQPGSFLLAPSGESTSTITPPPTPTPTPNYCGTGSLAPNTYIRGLTDVKDVKEKFKKPHSHLHFRSGNAVQIMRATMVVCAGGETVFQREFRLNPDSARLSKQHTIDVDVAFSDVKAFLKNPNEFKIVIQTDRPAKSQPSMDIEK
jgi:hypothetical protein